MMQTEIKILQYSGGQIVKTFDLDLFDDVAIPVNKSIIDIKEPEKRKSDYTLPIRVPATSNNRAIFSNIQNLNRSTSNTTTTNFNPDFNVNLKTEALVIRSGIILMRGYLQLTEIPINDQEVQYELIIIGKLANLFQDLGEKKLSEINLSEFNHAWNYSNIANSWANNIIKNGTTYNNFVSGNPNGEGYVYPLIDNGLSKNNQELEYYLEKSMYPSIYVKQIVDKIFSEAGYRYESNFFNSTLFKRLISPFTGGKFIASEGLINDKTFIVSNSSNTTYTSTNNGTIISDVKRYNFNTIVQDTDPVSVDLANDKIDVNASTAGFDVLIFEGQIKVYNNTGATLPSGTNVGVTFNINNNSALTGFPLLSSRNFQVDMGGVVNGGSVTKSIKVFSSEIDTNDNDELYVEFYWVFGSGPQNISVEILANSKFYSSPSSKYTENDIIDISSSLPKEIKQKDFLTWLFRAFNLYAVPDSIDANKLIIEPRDDFYTNEVVDLTNNLDVSSELLVTPMGVLDFRDFEMSYKEDKDEYNTKYQELFTETYGTKKYRVQNDFLTQTNKVEVGFSASPLSNSVNTHDRIFTKIRKTDPNSQNSELPSYNMRILYYGGLVETTKGWKLITKYSGTVFFGADFPYAGMLDNTLNPTFDLSFAQPKAIYYGVGSVNYTNGNLFNRYWKKTIEEITDKDSKLIKGKFKLNEVEFNALSFRKIYKIQEQFYRLNNVSHNINSNEKVELEFLKLKNAPAFSLVSGSGNGGSGGVIADEEMPMYVRADNTTYFDSQVKVQFKTMEQNSAEDIILNFSSDINFIETSVDAFLPDASNIPPLTGDPIIIVKNINGGSVKIYPINTANLVNGGNSFTLQHQHCVWFVAYKGNWQVLNTVNTGGG